MESAIIPALSLTVGILLFLVGYLLGERRRPETAAKPEPVNKPAESPTVSPYKIPKAPPTIPPESSVGNGRGRGGGGIRVVSPREAIFQDRQKRDGLLEAGVERIPPAVAQEFLNEAANNHKETAQ